MAKTATAMLVGIAVAERHIRSVDDLAATYVPALAESQVLGLLLTSAVGRSVAEYFEDKIWKPIGAEADASWLIDRAGQEATWCCLNAVLRDYARLALLLAHGGNWRGRQLIPAAWIEDATRLRPEQPHLLPGIAHPFAGYGYHVWINPPPRRTYSASGALGQWMFVDPVSRLVMVHTAVRKRADDPGDRETNVLWRAVVQRFGAG